MPSKVTELSTNTLLKALDLVASQEWLRLGQHPLAGLQSLTIALEREQLPDDDIGRGKTLGRLLQETVAHLVPDDASPNNTAVRAQHILQARLAGIHPKTAAPDLGLSVDRWYALQRDEAVPRLRSALRELEQAAHQAHQAHWLARNLPPPSYTRLFGVTDKQAQLVEALAQPHGRSPFSSW